MENGFDLAAMQKRRDESLAQGENWTLTANELYFAWRLGERTFRNAIFEGSIRRDADFAKTDLSGIDLRWANLRGSSFHNANLEGAKFIGANLQFASLTRADLRNADLRNADLWSADLRGADLRFADLEGANLGSANLRDADLRFANVRGADFARAKIKNARGAIGSIRTLGMSSRDDTLDAGIDARGELIFWSEFQDAINATELRAEIAREYGDSAVGSFYLMATAMFEASFAERQRLADLRR